MKINVFIFLIFYGIPLFSLAQSIPNGDFEIWSFNDSGMPQPQFWETQNEAELIYVESLPGHTGNHAACLNVQWDFMFRKYCGATIKSEFNLSEPKKFQNLLGYYKGNSENTDTLIIEVVLFFENNMIGSGSIKILDNSNNWEKFKVPIQYYSELLPNRANISISINSNKGSHSLSRYCIDDLLFANAEPINKIITTNNNHLKV